MGFKKDHESARTSICEFWSAVDNCGSTSVIYITSTSKTMEYNNLSSQELEGVQKKIVPLKKELSVYHGLPPVTIFSTLLFYLPSD